MFTSSIVFAGKLRSGQDSRFERTVLPILTNDGLQLRLQSLTQMLLGLPHYGPRVISTVNRTSFSSLFAEDWELQLDVAFYVGTRCSGQLPDTDNLLRPLFNGLCVPPGSANLPTELDGKLLHTLAVDDRQFTIRSVERVPFPNVANACDLTVVRFTALPPPHLKAARSF